MIFRTPHPADDPADDLARAHALDRRLVDARKTQRGAEHQLAVLLAQMAAGGFRALGYATIHQYASAVLDLLPRTTRDLIRIGRALPNLPVLNAALANGELDWTKARELVRVATPETEEAWVRRAQFATTRAIEHEVACAGRGDPPPEGPTPTEKGPIRSRVSFEMENADQQVLRQALALLRARSDLNPSEAEDGVLLAAMARKIIAIEEGDLLLGPWGEHANLLSVGQDAAEPHPAELRPGGARTIDPHTAEPHSADSHSAFARGGAACTSERYRVVIQRCPDCGHTDAPDSEVSDTIATEAFCDAEIVDMLPGPKQGHAARAIPPALRRRVFHRAGWKCEVPNCRNKLWLDVHHTHPWADSHAHEFDRLMVTCDAHHRAIHSGTLAVELGPNRSVSVEHADGRRYVTILGDASDPRGTPTRAHEPVAPAAPG